MNKKSDCVWNTNKFGHSIHDPVYRRRTFAEIPNKGIQTLFELKFFFIFVFFILRIGYTYSGTHIHAYFSTFSTFVRAIFEVVMEKICLSNIQRFIWRLKPVHAYKSFGLFIWNTFAFDCFVDYSSLTTINYIKLKMFVWFQRQHSMRTLRSVFRFAIKSISFANWEWFLGSNTRTHSRPGIKLTSPGSYGTESHRTSVNKVFEVLWSKSIPICIKPFE